METIIYQGQEVRAQKVHAFSGDLQVSLLPDNECLRHQGDEEIYRDEAGRLYLRRRLTLWDVGGQGQHRTSGREQVRRVSLLAAAQWALMRCDASTDDLRDELAALLTPPAIATSGARLFADGSMTVTMHLRPEVASLVRAVAEAEDDTPLGLAYTGLGDYVTGSLTQGGARREREIMDTFYEHAPDEDAPAGTRLLRLIDPADGSVWAEGEIEDDLYDAVQAHANQLGVDWSAALVALLEEHFAKQQVKPESSSTGQIPVVLDVDPPAAGQTSPTPPS